MGARGRRLWPDPRWQCDGRHRMDARWRLRWPGAWRAGWNDRTSANHRRINRAASDDGRRLWGNRATPDTGRRPDARGVDGTASNLWWLSWRLVIPGEPAGNRDLSCRHVIDLLFKGRVWRSIEAGNQLKRKDLGFLAVSKNLLDFLPLLRGVPLDESEQDPHGGSRRARRVDESAPRCADQSRAGGNPIAYEAWSFGSSGFKSLGPRVKRQLTHEVFLAIDGPSIHHRFQATGADIRIRPIGVLHPGARPTPFDGYQAIVVMEQIRHTQVPCPGRVGWGQPFIPFFTWLAKASRQTSEHATYSMAGSA